MKSREETFKEIETGTSLLKPGIVMFKLAKLQLEESDKQFRRLVILNVIVICISVMALVATVVFSALDYYGDKNWQAEQLKELKNINQTLNNENK